MTWTAPKTWSSEPLTSNDLNTYLRDNQNHLKNRKDNNVDGTLDEGSDYTTTSGSFVDVDATEGKFQHTITTNGGDVLVCFTGSLDMASNRKGHFNISVDGTDYFADDGCAAMFIGSGGFVQMISFVVLIEGLSATSHIFRLRWKTSNTGTAKIYAGAGTTDFDIHPQFFVQEI